MKVQRDSSRRERRTTNEIGDWIVTAQEDGEVRRSSVNDGQIFEVVQRIENPALLGGSSGRHIPKAFN